MARAAVPSLSGPWLPPQRLAEATGSLPISTVLGQHKSRRLGLGQRGHCSACAALSTSLHFTVLLARPHYHPTSLHFTVPLARPHYHPMAVLPISMAVRPLPSPCLFLHFVLLILTMRLWFRQALACLSGHSSFCILSTCSLSLASAAEPALCTPMVTHWDSKLCAGSQVCRPCGSTLLSGGSHPAHWRATDTN